MIKLFPCHIFYFGMKVKVERNYPKKEGFADCLFLSAIYLGSIVGMLMICIRYKNG